MLPRTLTILLQVIKELSTARLQRTRTNLQAVSPEIFHLLGSIYVDKVNQWGSYLEQGVSDETMLMDTLEQSLMSLKVIRRLIISGFGHPSRDKEVQDFWLLTHSHFSRYLSFVNGQNALPEPVHKAIEKHLLQLSKLHVEMARAHPASFALLPASVPLVQSYWTLVVKLGEDYGKLGADSEAEGKSLMEKTGLRALLLIRACARLAFNPANTFKYQTAEDKEERKQSVEVIKSQLFTDDFVVNVMELLVTQFFRFRNGDFQEWEEEPEEWERREAEISEAWEFSIRACSEKLFLDLVIHFKELLIPRLLNVFYSFASECPRNPTTTLRLANLPFTTGPDKKDILLKDSLYSAIGLAAASLEQHLDFNAFLESTLVPEVQIQEQGYNVLRRRIAIVLGQWFPVKLEQLNKNAIYQIFQYLLSKQDALNDLVVRITAGRQLRNVLDPYEFSPTEFMPYAPSILEDLMNLIQEVELSESKMALLDTVCAIVIKMEHHVCAHKLIQILVATLFILTFIDCPFLGSDISIVTAPVGPIWGGTLDEAGYTYTALGINRCIEAGFCQVSLTCPASDTKFGRTWLCEYIPPPKTITHPCANNIYKGVFALPPRGSLRALVIDYDANHRACISRGSFPSSCAIPDVRRRNR